MKAIFWLVCLLGVFIVATYLLVIFTPMTYLTFYSEIDFGPFSLPWVVDIARQGLEGAPQSYCKEPYLLVWNGSFGRLSTLPESHECRELVLGNTDIISEHTRITLTAMSDFNSKLIEVCF